MRNYAERNDCQLSRYGDFRSGTEGGGGRYSDCPLSSLSIIMCKGRLYTHTFFLTALVVFFFVVLFFFSSSLSIFQYEVAEHTPVTIKRERERERERERAKGPGDLMISKEVRT